MKKILLLTILISSITHATLDLKILSQAEQLYASHNIKDALTAYKNTLNTDAQLVQELALLGHSYHQNKQYSQAIALYRAALDINPDYVNIYLLLAECYEALKDLDHATQVYELVVKKGPEYVPVLLPAARFFNRQKKYDRALTLAQTAFKHANDKLDAQLLIAKIYNDQGRADEAIEAYRVATKVAPHSFHAHYNLGFALKIRGHLAEAQKELQIASTINPKEIGAHVGLAHAYWADNKLIQAWEQFEYRWQMKDHETNLRPQDLPYPLWDGVADLKGKTVFMYSEQGLGDTLQFIRFAKEVKKRGAKVVCAVQKPLRTLLKLCPYIDTILNNEISMHIDYQAPLMSMPYILKLNEIKTETPYLYADQKLVQDWKQKLSTDRNFKIGICWEVDLQHDTIKSSPLEWRSVPLATFAPLAQLPNVSFYSLQKINGEDQIKKLPAGFIVKTFDGDFDNSHGRFMDTAAVIANLDLIISADTAIAHLAGALNKPVWMVLPYSPECRWQFKRSDSDWYPTMRIFRQSKPFDWSNIAPEMIQELKKKTVTQNSDAQRYTQHAQQCHDAADIEGALRNYTHALKLQPNDANTLHSIAFMHRLRGDMPSAIEMLNQELALRPDYPLAHIALAHAYWVQGDYLRAFQEREWRWKAKGFDPAKQRIPLLNNTTALKNKTVLLYAEDGLGDTIQFVRFAQLLKARGARIMCDVQEPLMHILRSCPFIDTLTYNKLGEHLASTAIDYQAPLMSLPHILHINEAHIPNAPYLKADTKLVHEWRTKMDPKQYNVGICFHVEPKHELHASPVCKRAINAAKFEPLTQLNNVQLYSLHKNGTATPARIHTCGTNFDTTHGAFMDTAALIENLDLVITVDTSIAHLAGALGKKVWLILPTSPDCRWQLNRTDSPWYPTMRIFRQREYGNWKKVIEEIRSALAHEAKKK